MGILIYLVPAFALWALIATGLAFVRGRQLRAESGQLANTQDSLARYQAALSQLKARAAASTLELESLQRSYAAPNSHWSSRNRTRPSNRRPRPR